MSIVVEIKVLAMSIVVEIKVLAMSIVVEILSVRYDIKKTNI